MSTDTYKFWEHPDWGWEPVKVAPVISDREFFLKAKREAEEWLETHPEPEPKTYWQAFLEGLSEVWRGFSPPPPTTEELIEDATEMVCRAYMISVIHVCNERLKELNE